MKKSNVISFLLGAIIFGSVGVVSAYSLLAKDIGYNPKDNAWKKANGDNITNVKEAIDELYSLNGGSSFNFNTTAFPANSLYKKEYDVEPNKYYVYLSKKTTNNVSKTGGDDLGVNLFVWSYDGGASKLYLGVIKSTSNKLTFSENVTIALLGS